MTYIEPSRQRRWCRCWRNPAWTRSRGPATGWYGISWQFKGDRAAGAGQTEASSADIVEFFTSTSAYRHGHSTQTALLHVTNSVYAAADDYRATILVCLDMSAAFDTINHDVLLNRLRNQFELGIDGGASSWLLSYLVDRNQYAKLSEHSSATTRHTSGVPQGSVLGPLLFTAYASLVGDLIESHSVSYCQVHRRHAAARRHDRQRHGTGPWEARQLLRCCAIVVTAKRPTTQRRQLRGRHSRHRDTAPVGCHHPSSWGRRQQVAGRTEAEFLGVTIDSNLWFDYNARHVARACNYHTRALLYVRSLLTEDLSQTVACSIVASRLDYCNAILFTSTTWSESSASVGVVNFGPGVSPPKPKSEKVW